MNAARIGPRSAVLTERLDEAAADRVDAGDRPQRIGVFQQPIEQAPLDTAGFERCGNGSGTRGHFSYALAMRPAVSVAVRAAN